MVFLQSLVRDLAHTARRGKFPHRINELSGVVSDVTCSG